MRKFNCNWLLFVGVILIVETVVAQPLSGKLFDTDSELEVSISAPFERIFGKKGGGAKAAGKLSYTDPSGETHSVVVEISTGRGMRTDYCQYPPLTLRLDSDAIVDTPFEGLGALYVTTHCRSGRQSEQYMHMEFQIYRMYRILTEHALAVRRLKIQYAYSDSKHKPINAYGYVIEDVNATAARLGKRRLKVERQELAEIDLPRLTLLSLFQFMIGNTDWSATRPRPPEPCCHNMHIVAGSAPADKHIAIAFDFDQAGLINTRYATPSAALPIKSVRQRLYRGFCEEAPYLQDAISVFNEKREQLEQLFRDDPLLSTASRNKALGYLTESYRIINTESTLQGQVSGKCRQ